MSGTRFGDDSVNGERTDDRSRTLGRVPPSKMTVGTSQETVANGGDPDRQDEDRHTFVYQVAHDLKEPLHVIKGTLEIATRKLQDGGSEDLHEDLTFALDNTHRAQQMVTSLLEQAHLASQGSAPEPVDAEALIEEVLSNQQARMEEMGARVTYDPLPTVFADLDQLVRLFQNLIGNAIKYRGEGPPRVHITHGRTASGEHRFSVIDDGIGVPDDEVESIFEMFSRGHPERDREGTGMGLALCEQIVENHGGRIWVESTPGEGATFHFTLRRRPTVGGSA